MQISGESSYRLDSRSTAASRSRARTDSTLTTRKGRSAVEAPKIKFLDNFSRANGDARHVDDDTGQSMKLITHR
jgi:hypothetical protein